MTVPEAIPGYSLAETPRRHVRQRPDAPALVFEDVTLTYGDFDKACSRVANAFKASGIAEGDRVAFLGKNIPEYFTFAFGAAKIGAVTVGVNWRLAPPEIDFILDHGEVKLLVIDKEYLGHLDVLKLAGNPIILTVGGDGTHPEFADWMADHSNDDPGFVPHPDDTAMQVYTSGTTGKPKGVEITHRNLGASFAPFIQITGLSSDSVTLQVLPMFHIGGSMGAYLGLWCGSTNVVQREINPADMLPAVAKHRVTNIMSVPAVLQMFPAVPGAQQLDLSSVKLINYGASPISQDVLDSTMELFGCPLTQTYGLTESCGLVSYLPPEDHDPTGPRAHLMRSAGKPTPGAEIKIVGPDGKEMPEGETGEIWTRSYQNMKGFWKDPEATAAVFPEGRDADGLGWLATGDAGAMEGGYLFIKDRVKDMIVSGAENIYPAEIENVLMSHPDIADTAVIGIPSEKWGETPLAFVVAENGYELDSEDIIAYCAERLARYKLPSKIEFVKEIPRNPSGKILKVELRKPYWKGHERAVN